MHHHRAAAHGLSIPLCRCFDPVLERTNRTRLPSQVTACPFDHACTLRLPEVVAPSTITQATSSFVGFLLSSHVSVVTLHLTARIDRKTLCKPTPNFPTFVSKPLALTTDSKSVIEASSCYRSCYCQRMTDRSSRVRPTMVTTRSSSANIRPISFVPLRPSKRRKNTTTLVKASDDSGNCVSIQPSVSLTSSTPVDSTVQHRPSSRLSGLARSLPSKGTLPQVPISITVPQPAEVEAKPSTEQILAELKKLTTPGTSHNPIELLEDSPGRGLQQIQETLRKACKAEPHKFQDRHSMLYTYSAPRPALAPRPANGSTFTGHPGQDMYRMRTAKIASGAPHSHQQDLPFATRHLALQPGGLQYAPVRPSIPYVPLNHPPALMHYPISTPLKEDQLRSKALQYVREYSRSSSRKRKIAEDPDETSESDSTEVDSRVRPSLRNPSLKSATDSHARFSSGPVTILPDPHFELTPLIEHASLLTSLLRVCPRSKDQKGLREDIAMLASVQNQHLADWLNFEVGQSRKIASPHTPRVSRGLGAAPGRPISRSPTVAEVIEAQRKQRQDAEVRGLLSAGAKVWQDGSGLSVADVYSDDKASTPEKEDNDGSRPQEGAMVVSKAVVPVSSAPVANVASASGRPGTSTLVTPSSPRVARVASSPAVRTSDRKRAVPARFRNE